MSDSLSAVNSDGHAYQAYMIINTINGLRYIGIFKAKISSPCTITGRQGAMANRRRWYEHIARSKRGRVSGTLLSRAIREFGKDAFSFEVIASARSWSDLCDMERSLIDQYDTFYLSPSGGGYNMTIGGDGCTGHTRSIESRQKIAAKILGIKRSNETIAKLKLKKLTAEQIATRSAKRRGKKQSTETIEKRAQKLRGKTRSDEVKLASSLAQKGKKLSEKHRSALSAARAGIRLSEDHKNAISAALKDRTITDGVRAAISSANGSRLRSVREEVFSLVAFSIENNELDRRSIIDKFKHLASEGCIYGWIRRAAASPGHPNSACS